MSFKKFSASQPGPNKGTTDNKGKVVLAETQPSASSTAKQGQAEPPPTV